MGSVDNELLKDLKVWLESYENTGNSNFLFKMADRLYWWEHDKTIDDPVLE